MKLSASLLLLAAATALPAYAQNIKPGLWEIKNKMQSGNGQMEKAMAMMEQQMASMSPEQRKAMEDMMAKQGVNMSGASGGGISVKTCMSKEMVAQNHVPMQQHGNCTQTRSALMGNSMKVSFTCTNPPASGEGQIVFSGDTGYAMSMKVNSTVAGRPETMTLDSRATWLSADCGNIKPHAMPPPPKAKP
jgi:hypothetical protein